MCLEVIQGKFVAKEDIEVYKWILFLGGKEYSRFARTNLSKKGIMIAKSIKPSNKHYIQLLKANGYKAYFHCWKHPSLKVCLPIKAFIIPKGTHVTVGQDIVGDTVYVTRRLINPRMN